MKLRKFFGLFFILMLASQVSWAEAYKVDKDHTSVSFKIRHLFSNVQGSLRDFEGTVEYDPEKPENSSAVGTIQAASIDTNVPERDKHLKSKDFFDVEQFPVIAFKTTKVTAVTKESAKVEGELTIHGITKPVVLDVQIHGAGADPWGNVRAGFTATTKINRKDFGIVWNQVLDKGQLMVGDEVIITIELEAIKT